MVVFSADRVYLRVFVAILSVWQDRTFCFGVSKWSSRPISWTARRSTIALAGISHEIIERNGDSDEICLVGIMRRGGAPLADILASKIESLGVKTQKGYLDITLSGRPERERESADGELRQA